MRKITSFLLSMILALVAIPIQAAIQADVVIDQEFSSLAELEGKAFAIVNKETGKALFGTNNQNLGYDVLSVAFSNSNSGYYFKLDAPVEDPEDASIAQCHLLRLQTPAGEGYNIWGDPGYLNSQPSNGSVSFILGVKNKGNGQDIKNGAVWDIQYVEGKGFTLLNKGTGLYLNDNAPAKYEEPVYWTFCTLKKDWMTAFKPLFDEEAAIKACGTSEEANAAYDAIVDPIKAKVESGNIADAEADLATIDAALTDLAKAQTKAGADFTRVIVNPEINGADGWTIEKPLGGNGPLLNNSFEYWAGAASDRSKASFDYYQVISGLVNGAYTVTADMYNSLNGEEGATWNATSGVYGKGANESVTLVNEEGMTLKPYTTDKVVVEDGTIRIGVKNTVTPMAARWFVADNFKLTYLGPVATEEDLAPLTAELDNAKLLGVDVSAWEGKTFVVSEVSAAIEAVKEAEYKSVLAAFPLNAGSLIPAFDAWEGGMESNKGQHWDGTGTSTYYEQAGNQWGQASWTNSKTTTVNLPKGKYVIYAAGRNSAGTACTSYIKVNDKTQIFPAKGDTGFGIATDGTATFDPSATYANNNAGRGWEYRYIAFEVTAEEGESVTLTVGGEATAEHQWMSVCVPVLLTTSDNVAIAKQTLAADITAAQAIVDAKAGVGEGLFLIPEEAFSTFSAAVEAAKAVNDNAEATGEEVAAAIAALAAATKTYKATPVNVPAADKQYTLTLYAPDGTELFPLSIVKGKISIEEVGTPITFVAKEGGKYALSNGTEEIYYSGSNNWDLDATTEGGYAWSISALANGKYYIEGKLAGRYLGTNNAEKAAGSKCYGDKKPDANVQWAISEYVAPAPTYAIAIAEGIENGTIAADVETAAEGATVTLTATPAEGYKLEAITVTAGEASVEVTEAEGAYTFVMPAAAVTVSATFVAEAIEPEPVDPNLIEIAQTIDDGTEVDGFVNQATKNVTDEYTEYTFKDNISLAFKMLNVDVKDCDYVVIKFAEPTPAGLKASFVEGEGNEDIPEGVTEWKNIIADNTAVKDGIIPQITLLTIFGTAGTSVKVEGVYKHKIASEPVEPTTFTIAIAEGIENGTVAADVETAEEGATVTLTATPAEGYKLEAITVTAGEASVEVTEAEGAYTFVMPAAAVTVSATFAAEAEELEVANVENMTLTVAEGTVIEEDKSFPVVFGYTATVDELIAAMASGTISYTVTAEGKEPINGETDFDVAKDTRNIWIPGLDNNTDYTITINSVSVSYFDIETLETQIAFEKKFEAGKLTATFNSGVPVGINGVAAGAKANRKVVENGRVVIYKNGVKTMSSGVSIR